MKSNRPHMLSLIAENMSIILSFAHSRASFDAVRKRAEGEWESLNRLIYEIPELRADRALLEMAYLFRAIDDAEGVSRFLITPLGTIQKRSGETTDMSFREMTNKVIHSTGYRWHLGDPSALTVECIGEDDQKWASAQIDLGALTFTVATFAL